MITAPGFSVNAKIEAAVFRLHETLLVNGTFFTEAYTMCGKHRAFHIARKAIYNNYGYYAMGVKCDDRKDTVYLRPHRNFTCMSGAHLWTTSEYATMNIVCNHTWTSKTTVLPVYNRLSGAVRRLDFSLRGQQTAHGILGQGLTRPRNGHRDTYPKIGVYTTRAQGEDAIDGTFTDYVMEGPFSTDFKFSMFAGAAKYAQMSVHTIETK